MVKLNTLHITWQINVFFLVSDVSHQFVVSFWWKRFNQVSFHQQDQFHSGFDFVPSASGHFVTRGRKGHICGQLLVRKLDNISLYQRDLFNSGFDPAPSASGHFVARGRQGHICGQLLVQKLHFTIESSGFDSVPGASGQFMAQVF